MRPSTRLLIRRICFTFLFFCFIFSSQPTDHGKTSISGEISSEFANQVDAPSAPSPWLSSGELEDMSELSIGPVVCPNSVLGYGSHMKPLEEFFSYESEWIDAKYNIFLQESSCNPQPTYRVWCAVESLAQQNPDAHVWYIMTSPIVNTEDGLVPALMDHYKNLKIITVDLERVFWNTPLQTIYMQEIWKRNNTFPEINLADIMRLALAWKMGGLYADSDFLNIRPVTELNNMIAWQEGFTLGSGVFHFTRQHPVLKMVMDYIQDNFQPEKWGSSGPIVFTRILKELCDAKPTKSQKKCLGVTLFPIRSFYPIPSVIWKTLFMPQSPRDVRKRYPSSYMIHAWNQLSYDQPIVKGSGSIYDEAAATFCPIARKIATRKSITY